ncbi:MAG: TRL-like family protein [Planctomycetaceae bacterium]|nr:TRL-like family protein [Planctomycetaceae bacterium]
MSRFLGIVFVGFVAAASLGGCSMVSPVNGSLYTDQSGPVSTGAAAGSSKRGEASITSVIGIAVGDASIETAMKNGGITKIHHVDSKARNILGVYAEYTTIVYGE